ncbi:MAG: HAD family hydrolase [Anaerolineales bacterium]|nr:HAD family hydrolase [Anaerolineales bacterium]
MALEPERIRALCFDVDGTLSDTDDLFVQKISSWLRIVRFIFPNRDPRRFARWFVMRTETPGNYLYGIPDRLGVDDEIAATGDLIYRLGLGKTPKPFLIIPGVQEMLSDLVGRFPLSVVSARGQRSTQRFLEQYGLEPYFKCVATAQTCARTKPYPDPILWAAQKMDVPVSQCLMIGDTRVDIQAGKAAGVQTIGVLCGFGEEDELVRAGADLILPTTADLAGVFQT